VRFERRVRPCRSRISVEKPNMVLLDERRMQMSVVLTSRAHKRKHSPRTYPVTIAPDWNAQPVAMIHTAPPPASEATRSTAFG